jgi:uncharacterized membrane protein YfhO
MPGWVPDGEQLGMKVWRNTNYIPMGFTYTNYITQSQFNASNQKDRILLQGILLNNEQIQAYSNYLSPISDDFNNTIDDAELENLCVQRNQYTCSSFSTDNYGFSAKITLDKPNLVFFSVPYDKGWTATVNGKPAKIEEVNIGFMAVLCPPGTSSIRFNYMTPGLFTGIKITAGSIVVLAGYLLIFRFVIEPKRKPILALNASDEDDSDSDEEQIDDEDNVNTEQPKDDISENNSENKQ